MSEPVGKPRAAGDLRQQIDLEDLERRMRESLEPLQQHLAQPVAQQSQPNDPLAELARLVGNGTDPFQNVFADRGSSLTMPPPGRGASRPVNEAPLIGAADFDYQRNFAGDYGRGNYDEPVTAQPQAQQDYSTASYAPQDYAPAQPYAYGYDAGQQSQQDAPWVDTGQQPHVFEDYPEEAPRRTGRAKLLIGAAAAVVVAGGAGAYFLRASDTAPREAPAIMAQSGPAKVQPAQPPKDGPRQSISVLERGAAGGAESKVVQTGEQPLDLANASRGQGANRPARAAEGGAPVTLAPPPAPPVANSIFAEPRRVKAVAVRPDGTIVDATPPAPVAVASPPAAPVGRPMDIASIVNATTPSSNAAGAATSGARPAQAPAPAPARATDARPAPTPPMPAARPSATPSVPPAAAATAPAVVASAAPAAAGAPGTFAVQLAGTTSEDEARDALSRLTRRFATELGGYRPAVVKAEAGSRTVYRVRITNLSNEDANTLCAKLKASGGTCFVARN